MVSKRKTDSFSLSTRNTTMKKLENKNATTNHHHLSHQRLRVLLDRKTIVGIIILVAFIKTSLLLSPAFEQTSVSLPSSSSSSFIISKEDKVVKTNKSNKNHDIVQKKEPKHHQQEQQQQQQEEEQEEFMHLKGVQALDRDLNGITVDVSYNLNVPPNWYDNFSTTSPSYNDAMMSLHGENIWEEETKSNDDKVTLSSFLDLLGYAKSNYKVIGSPLDHKTLIQLIQEIKPKIFLEVGVFQGSTSTFVANYFKTHGSVFDKSYVISMDTWLLDLRFAWNGKQSRNKSEINSSYFTGTSKSQGGYSTMYYHFLWNCIQSKTQDRIIPLPTASQNGAMTLLSHGIRPDMIYLDASHSNPDVYIDYENFYTILRPGGVIAFDDIDIPAVNAAFTKLVNKYNLEVYNLRKQAYAYKKKEKYEIDVEKDDHGK